MRSLVGSLIHLFHHSFIIHSSIHHSFAHSANILNGLHTYLAPVHPTAVLTVARSIYVLCDDTVNNKDCMVSQSFVIRTSYATRLSTVRHLQSQRGSNVLFDRLRVDKNMIAHFFTHSFIHSFVHSLLCIYSLTSPMLNSKFLYIAPVHPTAVLTIAGCISSLYNDTVYRTAWYPNLS